MSGNGRTSDLARSAVEAATVQTIVTEVSRDPNALRYLRDAGTFHGEAVDERVVRRVLELHGRSVIEARGEDELGIWHPESRFPLYTEDDLRQMPEREYLIDQYLPRGFNVMFGQPATKKSFVALSMGCAIAAGKSWHGHETKQGPVVYVAAEGARGLGDRKDAWKIENRIGLLPDLYVVPKAPRLLERGELDQVIKTIGLLPVDPALIIIDTLSRTIVGGNENAPESMGVYIDNVTALGDAYNAATLVIHHSGWDGTHERGHSSLFGAEDGALKVTTDGDNVTVKPTKNKDDAEAPDLNLHAVEVGKSLVLRLGSNHSKISAHERAVLEELPASFGSDPAPNTALKAATGLPERSYYRAVQSLVDQGLVTKETNGRTTLYSLSPSGLAQLLPTAANDCQASGLPTAASAPPLRGAGGSSHVEAVVATDEQEALYARLVADEEMEF